MLKQFLRGLLVMWPTWAVISYLVAMIYFKQLWMLPLPFIVLLIVAIYYAGATNDK